jgi:hypothetical protein
MAAEERVEVRPLGFVVQHVAAEDQVETLAEVVALPVDAADAGPAVAGGVEPGQRQAGGLDVAEQHVGPEQRGHRAGQAHAAAEVEHARPPASRRLRLSRVRIGCKRRVPRVPVFEQPLPDARGRVPQLRPVRQPERVVRDALPGRFFVQVDSSAQVIEHLLRVGDAGERTRSGPTGSSSSIVS